MRSKRIALTNDDIVLICSALEYLHDASGFNFEVYSERELSSRQRINEIRNKLGRTGLPLKKIMRIEEESNNATENTPKT